MTVLVEKFNPRHDTRGRFASTAAGRIAAGHEVKAQPHEVAAIVDSMHGRSDHPNLTYLNVEGTHLFNRGGKHDREDMPQVPSHRKAEFVDAMKARGVTVARVDVDPLTLKASQGEISGRSVADIVRRERAGTPAITGDAARITISSDGYVLDGHHRWGAHSVMALDGDPVTVPAFRIDLPKDKALQVLRDWNAEADVQSLALGERARKAVLTLLEKYNHAHDNRGRFATTSGGGKVVDSHDSILAAMGERGWDKGAKPLGHKDFQRLLDSGDYVLYYRGGPKGHTRTLIDGGYIGGGDLGEGVYLTRDKGRAKAYLPKKKGEMAQVLMPRAMHDAIQSPKAITHPPEGSALHRWRTEHGITAPYQPGARVAAISVGIPGLSNDRGHAGDVVVWNIPDLLVLDEKVRKDYEPVEKRFYTRDALGRFATTGGGHSTTVDGKPLPEGWTRVNERDIRDNVADEWVAEGMERSVAEATVDRLFAISSPVVYTDGKVTVRMGAGPSGLPDEHHERAVKQIHTMQQVAPLDHATIRIDDYYVTTGSGSTVPIGVLGWTSFEHPDKPGHAVIALRPSLWTDEKTHSGTIPFNVRTGSDYVVAHEWGHAVVQPKAMGGGKEGSLYQMFGSSAKDVSGYALTSPAEFYAEIFADWHASHGTTTRPVTRKAAKEFGWFGGEDA